MPRANVSLVDMLPGDKVKTRRGEWRSCTNITGAMRKERTLSAIFLVAALLAVGCFLASEAAGGSERRAAISPIFVRLEPGAEQRFTIRVNGRAVRAARWCVNDVPGGNSELGTISRDGVYQAPRQPPKPNEVHIEAVVEGAENRLVWSTVLIGRANPTYRLAARWGERGEGKGQFLDPHGIALDNGGNLLITDPVTRRVYRFTTEGKLLGELSGGPGDGPGALTGPRDVRLDADGNILVLDGSEIHVHKFSPSGELLAVLGEPGSAQGQPPRPHGFALGKDGRIYVADVTNNRVVVLDKDGKFLTQWGGQGAQSPQFNAPHAVATDRNGDVFVVEFSGRCQKFTSDGRHLFTFADQAGTYHAMTSDRWGDVYLMAREPEFGACIVKYNNNGAFVTRFRLPAKGEEGFYPKCAFVDGQGRIYLTESSRDSAAVTILAPE